ncbi:hypothetical protein [Caldicellulosiruptor kronotskyensis]|uniref:hypothetical protein n=1 Tax=Caldicellulosiruptor kronotskyensis TaxID=413889 RepID=UPI0001E9AEA8|nr:hypothetical protein [Caldicellulosiruptor kronotskyensis]
MREIFEYEECATSIAIIKAWKDFIYCNSIDEVKQKQQIGTSSANLKVKRKNRLIGREILVRTEKYK